MLLLKMCFVIVAVIAIIIMCISASTQEFSKAFAGNMHDSFAILIGGILTVVAVAFFILLASLVSVTIDKRREFRHAFL
jgi:flagellar biosynthesis protein FlhB